MHTETNDSSNVSTQIVTITPPPDSNDDNWLQFSIPFQDYQNLLRPLSILTSSVIAPSPRPPSPPSPLSYPSPSHPLRPSPSIDSFLQPTPSRYSAVPTNRLILPDNQSDMRSMDRKFLKSSHITSPSTHEVHSKTSKANVWPSKQVYPSLHKVSPSFTLDKKKGELVTDSDELLSGSGSVSIDIDMVVRNGMNQSRSSSIFAGHGPYIDTEKSSVKFQNRRYRPFIGRHWWNGFMFTVQGRRRFITVFLFIVISTTISMALFDPMSLFSLYFTSITFSLTFIFSSMIILHWIDVLLFLAVLSRWDSLVCFFYLTISATMSIWKSTLEDTVERNLRIFVSISSNLGATTGYMFLLFSDACPRPIFPRWAQMATYLFCTIAEIFVWLQVGPLQDSLASSKEPVFCLYGCMSISRLHSLAAANLAFYSLKFFVSLYMYPKAAVVIKARINLENE